MVAMTRGLGRPTDYAAGGGLSLRMGAGAATPLEERVRVALSDFHRRRSIQVARPAVGGTGMA